MVDSEDYSSLEIPEQVRRYWHEPDPDPVGALNNSGLLRFTYYVQRYTGLVIVSFAERDTEKLHNGIRVKRFEAIQDSARKKAANPRSR
jgi:hypothetical protein